MGRTKTPQRKPPPRLQRKPASSSITRTYVLLAMATLMLLYGVLCYSQQQQQQQQEQQQQQAGGQEAVTVEVQDDVNQLVNAGRVLIENMAFADALAVFKKAHALQPENTVCGLYLANMLVANRKYRAAAARFDATLRCCAPRGATEIKAARARGDKMALELSAQLLYGLGLSLRYTDKHDFGEQRATLHAELELIEKGAGDALIEKLEKQVAEEEEEQRQKLEMERMEREFFKDE